MKMLGFDPDAPGTGNGIYGLPFAPEEARVVVIPVPWEATVSYRAGTAGGPEAVRRASLQVDLQDRDTGRPYEGGIAMLPVPEDLRAQSDAARALAAPVIEAGGPTPGLQENVDEVNALCEEMNAWVMSRAEEWLDRGKLVAVVGGDHSSPFGAIQAVSEAFPGVGILHLDAHADLREAYEGFTWSHASIMFNVLRRLSHVSKIVQVGLRDVSTREAALIEAEPHRLTTFYDSDLRAALHNGRPWGALMKDVVAALPREVYLSFDIDGLDPTLCPSTGTPVPGGLSFPEAVTLLRTVEESGRRIVGLDLSEVAPSGRPGDEWDGNVAARLLYKMIGFALKSQRG
jgi:agmatinase